MACNGIKGEVKVKVSDAKEPVTINILGEDIELGKNLEVVI